jgi:hypothetical protein
VGPVPLNVLDRRAGKSHTLPKVKTGIPIYEHGYYNVRLVNDVYLALVYAHQLCWTAYKYGDKEPDLIRIAKRSYHLLRRKLSLWDSVLCHSATVRQYWSIVSATLRIAQGAAKLRGRPLCGNDRVVLQQRPNTLGSRIKVDTFFSEESSKGLPLYK